MFPEVQKCFWFSFNPCSSHRLLQTGSCSLSLLRVRHPKNRWYLKRGLWEMHTGTRFKGKPKVLSKAEEAEAQRPAEQHRSCTSPSTP